MQKNAYWDARNGVHLTENGPSKVCGEESREVACLAALVIPHGITAMDLRGNPIGAAGARALVESAARLRRG